VLILNQGTLDMEMLPILCFKWLCYFSKQYFSLVNPGKTLGDTGQDIGLYNNDLAFVVLNYSNKIEVINRYTICILW
jgi:hypothetical protein